MTFKYGKNGEFNILVSDNLDDFEKAIYYQFTKPEYGKGYCSATALASTMSLYYDDPTIIPDVYLRDFNNTFNWGNDPNEEIQKGLGNLYGAAADNSKRDEINWSGTNEERDEQFSEYVNNIKDSLAIGRPVVICVPLNGNTHYVTVVGIKSSVNLEDATYNDLVIIDPGTQQSKQVALLNEEAYKDYSKPYNFRIVVPYLVDENNNLILDDKGNKIIDPNNPAYQEYIKN